MKVKVRGKMDVKRQQNKISVDGRREHKDLGPASRPASPLIAQGTKRKTQWMGIKAF